MEERLWVSAQRDAPALVAEVRDDEQRDKKCIQIPSPFLNHPLKEGAWKQGHLVPQRGRQEAPAEILLRIVIVSGPSKKDHGVHVT